jgi:transmembrane sensor
MTRTSRPVLRAPLQELLDDRLPETQVQRIWRTLENSPARRARRSWPQSQGWAAAAAAAAVIAISIGAGGSLYSSTRPLPLAVRGAGTLEPSRTLGGAGEASHRLTDGSSIQLDSAARLSVLANDGHTFAVNLQFGRARFDVKAGGPRRWRIDCGEVGVEVAGASVSIDRAASGVSVRVEHGSVRVRGARVPSGEQHLTTGQRSYIASTRVADAAGIAESAERSR